MERSVATQSIHLDNNILGRLHIVPPLHVNTLGLDNVFDDAEHRAGRLGLLFCSAVRSAPAHRRHATRLRQSMDFFGRLHKNKHERHLERVQPLVGD